MSEVGPTRATLVARMRNPEDRMAWEDFVRIYTPLVFGFCRGRGLQEADAADVSQEVMKAVAGAIGRFDYDPAKGTFRSWLFRIVRSKLSNHFAARDRHPQGTGRTTIREFIESVPQGGEEAAWESSYRESLLRWAAGEIRTEFKPATWDAFVAVAVNHEDPKTVGQRLGMSVGAVYIARSRVVARLKEKIESLGDEPWDFGDGGHEG